VVDSAPSALSEHAFEQFLDAVPDAVFVTADDGHMLFANQQAEVVFGYERDELLNQPIEILIPERFRVRHVPQRLAYAEAPRVRPMGQGMELLGLRKDGQEFPVEISLSPATWQGQAVVVSTVRDVTERKEAEAAIHAVEERFQRFVEAVQDYSMILLDSEGRVASWNPGAERMKGYRAEEIVGQHFSCFYPQEAISEGRPELGLRAAAREGRWEDEGWRVRRDGSRFWANAVTTALYDGKRQLQGFAKITRDMSERHRADAQREQALVREQTAHHTAQVALRTRDEFMSAISHDLGQPLTVVNATLQLMRRFLESGAIPTGEELGEEVEAIAASTASMMAMVTELLDVARAASGRPLELVYGALDLVALVQGCVPVHQQMTGLPYIRVETADTVLPIDADRDRLTRVVSNLLSNAVKYSPNGGTITVSLAQEQAEERNWAVLSVRDEGVGIPAAELPEIFERFHRGSNVRDKIAGTGIGLAGAKQTVELHGGDIRIESVEGKGTTVIVRLPLD